MDRQTAVSLTAILADEILWLVADYNICLNPVNTRRLATACSPGGKLVVAVERNARNTTTRGIITLIIDNLGQAHYKTLLGAAAQQTEIVTIRRLNGDCSSIPSRTTARPGGKLFPSAHLAAIEPKCGSARRWLRRCRRRSETRSCGDSCPAGSNWRQADKTEAKNETKPVFRQISVARSPADLELWRQMMK